MHCNPRRPSLLVALLVAAPLLACTNGEVKPSPGSGGQAVNVAVAPGQVEVAPSTQVGFAAVVTGTANTSVTWGVQEPLGGSVTATGLYTAPASAGTFHVVATSQADATKQGVATVTVSAPPPPPPPIAVTVTPATGAVDACQTLQLGATVTGTTNTAVTWSVQEGAAGGTVASNGLYTAPSGPGTYHAVATSAADPTKTAVATLTVSEHVLSVAVTPAAITLSPGGTAQFTATVTNTCGVFTAARILTASPGGLVTAN
jgi:hypothetical protein